MAASEREAFEFIETGTEPEYFVTATRFEPAGNGNIRIYCYSSRGRYLRLLYTTVMSAQDMARTSRDAGQAAAIAHNLKLWEDDGRVH